MGFDLFALRIRRRKGEAAAAAAAENNNNEQKREATRFVSFDKSHVSD